MNVYEIVTEKIVSLLEAGTIPWRKPWASKQAAKPCNLVSKKPYRGINVLLLTATGYASPYWLTYKQATELGGNVRKGEKSTMIVFWKVDRTAKPEEKTEDGEEKTRSRFVLRYYRVFNVEQCDLPEKVTAKLPKPEAVEPNSVTAIAACEQIVAGMPKKPSIGFGSAAFYIPSADSVTVPEMAAFNSVPEYYGTLFHELGHSTGHKSRIGRQGVMERNRFGSEDYSKEELVAEMTSAFLCAEAEIMPAVIDNQAAYIANWLKALKNDQKMIVFAAAQAQKAADFILDRKPEAASTDSE